MTLYDDSEQKGKKAALKYGIIRLSREGRRSRNELYGCIQVDVLVNIVDAFQLRLSVRYGH